MTKPHITQAREKRITGNAGDTLTRARASRPTDQPATEPPAHNHSRLPPRNQRRLPPGLTTVQRKTALIEAVAATGDEVNAQAHLLGIHRATVWQWRRDDKNFAAALEYAYRTDGTQALVSVAVKRAVEGWDEPVFFKGKECGKVRKYDHGLLMMLIRKRDPSYRDPKYAVAPEAPRQPGDVMINLDKMPPQLRDALRKEAERQANGAPIR